MKDKGSVHLMGGSISRASQQLLLLGIQFNSTGKWIVVHCIRIGALFCGWIPCWSEPRTTFIVLTETHLFSILPDHRENQERPRRISFSLPEYRTADFKRVIITGLAV